MGAEWFYQIGGQPSGPVDSTELQRLVKAGVVRPDTLVRQGANGRWVRAEHVRGLFQRSTPSPSPSVGGPPPLALLPESGAPSTGVSGESALRHGLRAAPVNQASDKPERLWPITWAAIIVGSGTVLLLLWAIVFRGGRAPDQQAEQDQALLAAAQAESKSVPTTGGAKVLESELVGPSESKSVPATGGDKVLELPDLAELVRPSVVQVNVTRAEGAASGSGFVLDKQGTIVTNFHVVDGATAGTIVFSDKSSAPITGYLGAWPEKDIALLRVECPPEKLRPLRLATSAPRQGERVAAFGSPLGLQQSVSEGIVSAVREGKEVRALVAIDVDALLIQTTAPISKGNSGGPLVDMKGMVVGVNTLTFRPLGGENVNFAVAAADIKAVLGLNSKPLPLPIRDVGQSLARNVAQLLIKALFHVAAKDYDLAIAECTEAIRLDPNNAWGYCLRGDAHLGKGDYNSAIADYTQAIQLEPNQARAYFGRGEAYLSKRDYDSAIADYTEAIRLDPKNAAAYSRRGDAYGCKGDYDSAIADYTQAIRLDPEYAWAYSRRGDAYRGKGDYDSAIADYTQAIRLDPKNAWAYTGRGEAYRGKRDFNSAIADYTQAIRLDPKCASAYAGRGYAYLGKGDYDSAIADCTEAIRLEPNYGLAYEGRGWAYLGKSDYDSAIADFTQAIRLDPNDANAYEGRGLAYQAKGQYAAAQRDFARAKQLRSKP